MKKYTIGMLVSNQFGVLTRISGMFARRGFNIDSLVVGETEDSALSRMTITMSGEDSDRDQILKQLEKLHDVYVAEEMIPESIVSRELILIKVRCTPQTRSEILDAVSIFRTKIIDYTAESVCIEVTGETTKADAFIELMRSYGIIEMCRTGSVSLDRGAKCLDKNKNNNL